MPFPSQAELLLQVLQGPSLVKGDRGEIVALLLFLEARDVVVRSTKERNVKLLDFFQVLLGPAGWSSAKTNDCLEEDGDKSGGGAEDKDKDGDDRDDDYDDDDGQEYFPKNLAGNCKNNFENILEGLPTRLHDLKYNTALKNVFPRAEVHFNHFIRIEDDDMISQEILCAVIVRGAAILCKCKKLQIGVDVVIPFVIDAIKPVRPHNVSAILCRRLRTMTTLPRLCSDLFSPT